MPPSASPVALSRVEALVLPIHVPFAIAREVLPAADVVLVTLTDAAGIAGIGECAPFSSLTGDDPATAAAVARGLAEDLTGQAPLAALRRLEAQRREAMAASPTAYAGVESALWDLHARQCGRPLAALWGAAGVAELVTDITLPIMAPAAVAEFWRRYAGHGFKTVKVKVAGRLGDDLDLVTTLVATAPAGTLVLLDGNQGYRLDGAKALLAGLAAAGIRPRLFEQPLPADDAAGLAALTAWAGMPICLDESVRSLADFERAVAGRLGSAVNVKLMKSGIGEARAIIAAAQRCGWPVMIGGMLETEIAMGISLHLACGTGAVQFVDLDTPFFLTSFVTKTSPWHAGSARLVCPQGPGHGLTRA